MQLRELTFSHLEEAVTESRDLLASGYRRRGNWSLGQICQHLSRVQNPSLDGYPRWMSLFAPLRPMMRVWLMPRLLGSDSPQGIPTASVFTPAETVDDQQEVEAFAGSVTRLLRHDGLFAPHPAFGRLSREQLLAIHSAHAAHHLRLLEKER
ncbi:MAG: DUF1569 domain-containing protein [Planctomycetota bacterium]